MFTAVGTMKCILKYDNVYIPKDAIIDFTS